MAPQAKGDQQGMAVPLLSPEHPTEYIDVDHVSVTRSVAALFLGTLWSLVIGGATFGWPPIALMLKKQGIYSEGCAVSLENELCRDQEVALQNIFTIGSSCFNLALLPAGMVLDTFGPRATAFIGLVIYACGSVIFGLSSHSFNGFPYGWALMSIGGPPVILAALNIPNLFEKNRGMVMSIISSFGNCTAVFLSGLVAIDDYVPSFGYKEIFLYFYPSAVILAMFSVPIVWIGRLYRTTDSAPAFRIVEDSSQSESLLKAPPPSPKAPRSIWSCLFSAEWALMAAAFSIHCLHANFYIGTVQGQLNQTFGEKGVSTWTKVFGYALALGGIAMTPIAGTLVDKRGLKETSVYLTLSGVLFGIFALPRNYIFTITTWAVMTFYRTVLFSVCTSYVLFTFGTEKFGRLWGMACLVSAAVNLLATLLSHVSEHTLGGNYTWVNIGFALASAATAFWPLHMYIQDRKESKRAHEADKWEADEEGRIIVVEHPRKKFRDP